MRTKASTPRLCQRLSQANEESHNENPIVHVSCRIYMAVNLLEKGIVIAQLLVYPATTVKKLIINP